MANINAGIDEVGNGRPEFDVESPRGNDKGNEDERLVVGDVDPVGNQQGRQSARDCCVRRLAQVGGARKVLQNLLRLAPRLLLYASVWARAADGRLPVSC